MNAPLYKRVMEAQLDAALAMLEECLRVCPPKCWNATIGKYPFWEVAYHALYCTDLYTVRHEDLWKPHPKFHPLGREELTRERPSRAFSKRELLAYLKHCRKLIHASLKRETAASLRGKSGFSWLPMTRAEVHIYNMRHLQHHTGQLAARLRRAKVKTRWVKRGVG